MPEPELSFVWTGIHTIQCPNDVSHGAGCVNPTSVEIGKIDRAISAFLFTRETDRAPKGLDVAKHLGPERPDSGHPIAVQTPNEIVSDESVELLARNADPFGGVVWGEIDQLDERWIKNQFGHANKPKDGYGETGDIDGGEVTKSAKL
jgi:hypothetical protein